MEPIPYDLAAQFLQRLNAASMLQEISKVQSSTHLKDLHFQMEGKLVQDARNQGHRHPDVTVTFDAADVRVAIDAMVVLNE